MEDRHVGVAVQIRLPENVHDALLKAALAHNVTVSWLANMLVKRGLSKLKPPEAVDWFDD